MVTNYSMDEGEKASWFSISGTFNDHIPLLLSLLDAPPVSSDFQPGILFAPFPWLMAFPIYFLTGHIIFFQKASQKAEFYIAVHVCKAFFRTIWHVTGGNFLNILFSESKEMFHWIQFYALNKTI